MSSKTLNETANMRYVRTKVNTFIMLQLQRTTKPNTDSYRQSATFIGLSMNSRNAKIFDKNNSTLLSASQNAQLSVRRQKMTDNTEMQMQIKWYNISKVSYCNRMQYSIVFRVTKYWKTAHYFTLPH